MVDELQRGVAVLVHCSDGWDRTAQLTALAQVSTERQTQRKGWGGRERGAGGEERKGGREGGEGKSERGRAGDTPLTRGDGGGGDGGGGEVRNIHQVHE